VFLILDVFCVLQGWAVETLFFDVSFVGFLLFDFLPFHVAVSIQGVLGVAFGGKFEESFFVCFAFFKALQIPLFLLRWDLRYMWSG
jgi:hypothetical protein